MALSSDTAISNNKVDQLLSQSDWASPDDIPSVLFADDDLDHPHQPHQKDEGTAEYSYEADQRAAARLDSLLSNIEKRVEASHQLEKINARVHDSLVTYHTPYKGDKGDSSSSNHHPHHHATNYHGLPLETRERLSRSTRTEIESQMVDMHGRAQRVGSTLNDVSRWFGHATTMGLELTAGSHHHQMGKKRRRGKLIKGANNIGRNTSPGALASALQPHLEPRDVTIDDLQTEDGLRTHMEALDRMMSSVRQAATTLHETHQHVLLSRNNTFEKEREALVHAEGTWHRQLQTMKAKLSKKNSQYKKQESSLTSIKSALRESQLIVTRQSVENKESKEDVAALKKQIRRLQRSVHDAAGIQKEKRTVAENKLTETLLTLATRDGTILNLNLEIKRLKHELVNAAPKIITPTQPPPSTSLNGIEIEQRNDEMHQRHQFAMDALGKDHDQSVKRLKQQMLRLESGASEDLNRNIRQLERVLETQKKRWMSAIDSQRNQFEKTINDMKTSIQGNNILAARELELQKQQLLEQHALETTSLKQTLETIVAKHDSVLYKVQMNHNKEMKQQQTAHQNKLDQMQQSATNRLASVLKTQQESIAERDQWKQSIEKAHQDLLLFKQGAEKKRLKLSNATQTIEGLKYQLAQLNKDLLHKTKQVHGLTTEKTQLMEEQIELKEHLKSKGGYVEDDTMQLTANEASKIIETLGNRVLELENDLLIVKTHASTKKAKTNGRKKQLDSFHHFQKYSYMPKIIEHLATSLTSCGQLAHTLYFLREAPGWLHGTRNVESGGELNTASYDEKHNKHQQEMLQWKNYDWKKGWTEHLDTLSTRVDEICELYRSSITTFRAEIKQRKQYEELMCLHFYNREQHWKALYEGMVKAVKRTHSGPSSSRSSSNGGVLLDMKHSIKSIKSGTAERTQTLEVTGSRSNITDVVKQKHNTAEPEAEAEAQRLTGVDTKTEEKSTQDNTFDEATPLKHDPYSPLVDSQKYQPYNESKPPRVLLLERSATGATISVPSENNHFHMPQRVLMRSGGEYKGWTPAPPETPHDMRRGRNDSFDSSVTGASGTMSIGYSGYAASWNTSTHKRYGSRSTTSRNSGNSSNSGRGRRKGQAGRKFTRQKVQQSELVVGGKSTTV